MSKERVFVTGMGIISGIGGDVAETLDALLTARSGIGALRYLETTHKIPCVEVPLSDDDLRHRLGIDPDLAITRTTLLGMVALEEALKSSQLKLDGRFRVAFISGTTVGGMEKSEQYYLDFLENDTRNQYIAIHDCGACSEHIADHVGRFDMITTISTACSSAANALIMGANLIKAGMVDAAVVGGSECLTKFHLNGFNTLMILDSEPCRPFDETRAGLNLGEGAAYLVLESEAMVEKRAARALAELRGYGNACDAFHQTASSPEGRGAVLAMQQALDDAGLEPQQIDYINAHGTGTPNNDQSEGQAILTLFGENHPPMSSTKAQTGHTTSAAGGVEAVISLLALEHSFIPPTLNHRQDMSLPVRTTTELRQGVCLENVMSNSFGFGGNNSSIIFSRLTQ